MPPHHGMEPCVTVGQALGEAAEALIEFASTVAIETGVSPTISAEAVAAEPARVMTGVLRRSRPIAPSSRAFGRQQREERPAQQQAQHDDSYKEGDPPAATMIAPSPHRPRARR